MKKIELKNLIREEIRRVLAENVTPLDKAFGRILSIGRGNDDEILNILDSYLESNGLFKLATKWYDRNTTGTQLSTSEEAKVLKAFDEFYTSHKSARTNWKSVVPYTLRIGRLLIKNNTIKDDSKYLESIYKFILPKLSKESQEVFEKFVRSGKTDRNKTNVYTNSYMLAVGQQSLDKLKGELDKIHQQL